MTKKVALLAYRLSGKGGTETVYNNVLKHYEDGKTIQFQLLSIDSVLSKEWVNADIQCKDYLIQKSSKRKNKLITSAFLFLKTIFLDCDILITPAPRMLPILWLANKFRLKKIKLVAWIHFDLEETIYITEKGIQDIIKYSDAFLSLSKSNQKALIKRGYSEDKIILVYNPIKQQQKTIENPKTTTRFIYIGRLQFDNNSHKNNKELFDALSLIKDKKWLLDIYGTGEDEGIEKRYVQKLGMEDKIIFHGWTENPFDSIGEASAIVATSTFEGFHLGMAEAISYGIPVISTKINGPIEFVTHQNGVFYELNDIQRLSEILLSFIKENTFDREIVKKSIEKLYEENYYAQFEKMLENK